MRYEYNGNLLEEDRINLVANEIISTYPQISYDKAKEIAMLEGKISSDKNFDIEFNRLYNIMLVMKDDASILRIVCTDLLGLLKNNKYHENFDHYTTITQAILNFIMNKRDFPFLDEF